MKDQFDKYFESHREELDSMEPQRDILWNRIEKSMHEKANNKKLHIWRVAAILLAFLAIGQFVYILIGQDQSYDDSLMTAENRGAFESLEVSYQNEVSALQERVSEKKIDRSQYSVLFEELDYIDQVESEFKDDIPLANDRERLAAILIDTYEKKILLLERLLQQIDRNEKQEQKLKKNWVPLNNSNKSLSL